MPADLAIPVKTGAPTTVAAGFARPQSVQSFLAELLADQQRLQTPAARAAAIHDVQTGAFQGDRFRDLIPLSAPGPGEQYAFEVDLDSCSGCKACVAGCHSLNGLDETETWRDIGLVLGDEAQPFQQTVTTACHHCADPACLNGCPVLAYEKNPVTGIVVHLDDQCIGCSYCVLKCPYDVPKYNQRLGIVRKCDMCHGRLADGEAPACVQACPTAAIKIVTVTTFASKTPTTASTTAIDTLAAFSGTSSAYTQPTTRYVSKKPLPARLRPADAGTLRPQHAHLALVFLLVFTQLGLGLFLGGFRLSTLGPQLSILSSARLAGLACFAAGLVASVAHLGQPLRAWRIFLNLRRSWLSREAVLLGAAFPLLAFATLAPALPGLPLLLLQQVPSAAIAASLVALLGVGCSAMIYIDTRRTFWRPSQSFGRMLGTVTIAALALIAPPAAAIVLLGKLLIEFASLCGRSPSARLQRGPLFPLVLARAFAASLALLLLFNREPALGFLCFSLGELGERALYFCAVDSPKMPGVPS